MNTEWNKAYLKQDWPGKKINAFISWKLIQMKFIKNKDFFTKYTNFLHILHYVLGCN